MKFLIKEVSICLILMSLYKCSDWSPNNVDVQEYIPPVKAEILGETYGLNLEDYRIVEDTVREGNSFAHIFQACEVPYQMVLDAVKSARGKVNLKNIRPGSAYKFLFSKDSIPHLKAFIYDQDLLNYYIVHFENDVYTESCTRNVKFVNKAYTGVIKSSLWETIQEEHLDPQISDELANVFAWTVDFFRIFKGDRFKVVVRERYVRDTVYAGIQDIQYALFEHAGEPFYAFKYELSDGKENYYDQEGNSTRYTFLKAPIKYSRISSRYSIRRFHPVLGRWKSHKGTDYAAPRGTPIMTTANGVVTQSRYSKYNGNYVKIRHNKAYQTQYLHMSRREVKKGEHVKQGQIIGYVGSTGLATGPHVCYRFWKNGKQVDPYRQKLPKAKKIQNKYRQKYLKYITPKKQYLDELSF